MREKNGVVYFDSDDGNLELFGEDEVHFSEKGEVEYIDKKFRIFTCSRDDRSCGRCTG